MSTYEAKTTAKVIEVGGHVTPVATASMRLAL
jgi:hypothetical protein